MKKPMLVSGQKNYVFSVQILIGAQQDISTPPPIVMPSQIAIYVELSFSLANAADSLNSFL
jgi:hypothetical protein